MYREIREYAVNISRRSNKEPFLVYQHAKDLLYLAKTTIRNLPLWILRSQQLLYTTILLCCRKYFTFDIVIYTYECNNCYVNQWESNINNVQTITLFDLCTTLIELLQKRNFILPNREMFIVKLAVESRKSDLWLLHASLGQEEIKRIILFKDKPVVLWYGWIAHGATQALSLLQHSKM